MLQHLHAGAQTEEENILLQLTIERICADMCDFYEHFYEIEGPGAIVYVPEAKEEDDSMFYLPVKALAAAIDDFRSKEMEEPATMMQKTIVRAESLNPAKEALFLIQGESTLSLIHYNREKPVTGVITA